MTKQTDPRSLFGGAVRRLRAARGLSQEGFADLLGMHRTFVGGIERGERNPTLLTIWRIAVSLETTPSRLLREAESEQV